MRRGTAKKHAPESGLIGSVCHPGGALLASSKAPKRTSRAAWSGISLLPKLAMRSMLRRGKKRRPRVKDYVGAIDQGTTSTRFMVFDQAGRAVAVAQKEHEQIYPKPGWVEHDPQEILRRTEDVIADALGQRGLHASDLAAIGITNQRETTVVWDCKTGKPVAHAIVWQDTRVADDVKRFSATGGSGQHLLQWAKAALAARKRSRRTSKSRSGRTAFRKCRYVSPLEPHRRSAGRRACHRRDQCEPHATPQYKNTGLGRKVAGGLRGAARHAARSALEQRNLWRSVAGGDRGSAG